MKRLHWIFVLPVFAAVLAIAAGCAKKEAASNATDSDIAYYTCTMHPSVRSQDPHGKCPICGMDLVPVKKAKAQAKGAPDDGMDMGGMKMGGQDGGMTTEEPHEFTVPVDRQQMIGVTYATAETKDLRRAIRAVGVVSATTEKQWDYVSRVDGYIRNLSVGGPGDPVRKGEVLMDIYSPDLVATETELTDLLRMRAEGQRAGNAETVSTADHLLAGARARLEQWNVASDQIDALERTGKASQYLPLTAPSDGVVKSVAVHQGRHVSIGDHLVDLVDLSSVWVWAEFYENELPLLKTGMPVTITGASLPGASLSGKITVIDPFLNEQTRTVRVRIDVDNPDRKLLPGAYVNVGLSNDAGQGLAIPASAVLPTGEHNIVFVDKGEGRLEPRFIEVGGEYGDDLQVTGGLHAGERVVSSANFLIDAESKVQGALKDF